MPRPYNSGKSRMNCLSTGAGFGGFLPSSLLRFKQHPCWPWRCESNPSVLSCLAHPNTFWACARCKPGATTCVASIVRDSWELTMNLTLINRRGSSTRYYYFLAKVFKHYEDFHEMLRLCNPFIVKVLFVIHFARY